MRPKFEVGEEALLQSVDFPECSGDCTILEVVWTEEHGYCYVIDIKHNAEGYTDHWRESSLRKKHTPGEMTFDNLMASLSSPKLITHQT